MKIFTANLVSFKCTFNKLYIAIAISKLSISPDELYFYEQERKWRKLLRVKLEGKASRICREENDVAFQSLPGYRKHMKGLVHKPCDFFPFCLAHTQPAAEYNSPRRNRQFNGATFIIREVRELNPLSRRAAIQLRLQRLLYCLQPTLARARLHGFYIFEIYISGCCGSFEVGLIYRGRGLRGLAIREELIRLMDAFYEARYRCSHRGKFTRGVTITQDF